MLSEKKIGLEMTSKVDFRNMGSRMASKIYSEDECIRL